MGRRGILLVIALAACGKEGGLPREALPLRRVAGGSNVATLIQGRWTTRGVAGDTVWSGTEIDLRDGVAEESSIWRAMGEDPRRTVVGHGRYTLFGDHEIQIEMSGQDARRERFTFWHRTHHLTPPRSAGEHLLHDVYLATSAPNTFARRSWRTSKTGVEGLDAELALSPGVDVLLHQPRTCTVRLSLHASARGRSSTETHTLACHVSPAHPSGLVEIVIDDLYRPVAGGRELVAFVSRKDGQADDPLADLVEHAVDRELYLDPTHPEVVIRGTAVNSAPMLWHR